MPFHMKIITHSDQNTFERELNNHINKLSNYEKLNIDFSVSTQGGYIVVFSASVTYFDKIPQKNKTKIPELVLPDFVTESILRRLEKPKIPKTKKENTAETKKPEGIFGGYTYADIDRMPPNTDVIKQYIP